MTSSSAEPLLLHAAREPGAEIQKQPARRLVRARAEQFQRVEARLLPELRAHVGVHRREAARVGDPFQRLEVQLGQIDAVPIEAADQRAHAGADRAEALAIGQVHQLAPVQLRVLQHGGLLAPLGMIGPELLADVRQFEPGVHQDAFAMAGLDQLLQVRVAFRVGLEIVPGGHVQGGDPGLAPARREVVHVHARAVGGIEERPQAVAAEGRLQAEIGQRIQQIREALVAALAGRSGHPQDGARAALQAGRHGRAGPAFAGEDLRAFRNLEDRQLEPLLPDDGQRRDGARR